MVWNCDPNASHWGVGRVFAHCRGGEESCVEAKILSIKPTSPQNVTLQVNPSWKAAYEITLEEDGEHNISGDQDTAWKVIADAISTTSLAKIVICYDEDIVVPTCSDYTNQEDCEAHHCHWYDGACHGEPIPDGCPDFTNQAECEANGCIWEDGVCKRKEDPIPDGSTKMEINREVSLLGFGFKLREIDCARGEAVVEYVGTGLRRIVVLGGAMTMFKGTTAVVYMAAVWVNDQCTEIAARAVSSPTDPEEKGPETDSGKTIDEMDENKFDLLEVQLDPEELTEIGMEELKRRDIIAHTITTDTPQNDGTFTQEQWDRMQAYWNELLEDLAAGRITTDELWELWDEVVIEEVVNTFVGEKFTLIVPSIAMAGSDVKVVGRTPKKNMRIQIMAVKKYWGYDWLATDKVLKEVVSDDFFQYETDIVFDDFGVVAIYAKAPKDWYEFWEEDHDTDRVSIWVLTWTVVIALLLGIGLILEKKYNKLGIFKKR